MKEIRFTEHERWLFDLQGVITVEDALTCAECDILNAALDRDIASRTASGLSFQNNRESTSGDAAKKPPAQTLRLGDFVDPRRPIDAAFLQHVDNPRIAPYLDAMFASSHIAEASQLKYQMKPSARGRKAIIEVTEYRSSVP